MLEVDRQKIRDDWSDRGFSCDLWVDPPGQRWEGFRHAVDEVVMVVQGHMEFEIDGEIYKSAIGEELFIPAGAVHSSWNKGASTALWLYGYKGKPDC